MGITLKPLMIYDGDCGFCRRWIGRWEKITGDAVSYSPYQKEASRFPEIPLEKFQESVYLLEPDGRVTRGAEAVFRSLSRNPLLKWLPFAYEKIPGVSLLSEALYRWVAANRALLSKGASCGLAEADEPAGYFLARGAFLKLLALSNFFAFFSLRGQIAGLVGNHGIEPILSYLTGGTFLSHLEALGSAPTLLWFCPTDSFLSFLCGAGMVLSLLLFLGFLPFLSLALLWVFYLSLATVGGDFLSFQWDNLLLECDALALFLVPLGLRLKSGVLRPLPGLSVFLSRWLLFRLMVSSGLVKLLSGDPAWRSFTALCFHYETQPLPTPLAWWAHSLPLGAQEASCAFMFLVEIAVPFLIWGPRRFRVWAFFPLALLQILIALTGNYCFFNLLTLGLCFFTLEDAAWPTWIQKRFLLKQPQALPEVYLWRPIRMVFLSAALLLSSVQFLGLLGWFSLAESFAPLSALAAPFRSINAYGLFAVMTTTRREIIVEGSRDGKNWRLYEFQFKPGDLTEAPRWAAPLQPRLDWQMWFAALGSPEECRWLKPFLARLLQGDPEVTGLLKMNPFPDQPPQWIRAEIFEYHFTDRQARAKTGCWWERDAGQIFVPPFSLADLEPLTTVKNK